MPIRITGMNSGLDTESIISELVKAEKTKVETIKKKQTTVQWKQEAWKELNSKILNLFQKTLANMRFTTDYSKKITDVSNPAIATVVSSDEAMNTAQSLLVDKLAENGYMVGAEIKGDVSKDTKLTDIEIGSGNKIQAGSTITLTAGGKSTDIKITEDMTVRSFVAALKSAGVEANYDEKNKRLHIAASKSGEKNDFSLTASNEAGKDALKALGILSYDALAKKEYEKYAAMDESQKQAAIAQDVDKRLQSYISQREKLYEQRDKQQTAIDESKAAFSKEFEEDIDNVDKDALKQSIDTLKKTIEDAGKDATEEDKNKLAKLQGKLSAVENYEKQKSNLDATQQSITDVESYLDVSDPDNITADAKLTVEVTDAWNKKIATADLAVKNWDSYKAGENAKKTEGADATIYLNGIKYTGESNTFEVNGLTITALQKSSESVTLTTRQDTEGVYNVIKNFLKEYNSLINEMDKLYNAEETKDYEPLTEDEKKEMSDSDVEKWEAKIKGSILRRDSNLSTLASVMKNTMLKGATVNGKQMYLADFGIETGSWFTTAENEKNAYHINGDEDDSTVSAKANDLKAAIAADPNTVIAFFSELSNSLYSELNKQSSSIEGIRSFGSFYDDKKIQDDYNSYKEKIKKQEDKLTAMENRWYDKFTAMETAMAKMQSNQSAISSLLGG